MSRYYKATEVDEFLNIFGKGNCNLCAFYDDCNSRGLNRKGSHQYCWQAMRFPTADVTEVVRCKNCKYYVAEYCTRDIKGRTNMFYMCADDFCSYGERKDEE